MEKEKEVVVNPEISEIKDVTKIVTEIAEGIWEQYKDDDKITMGEIMQELMKKVPDTLMKVNFQQFIAQAKAFRVKDNKDFIKNDFLDMIWAMIFNIE